MTNQEVLIQEVQDEISAEMPERLRVIETAQEKDKDCLLYTSPSPRDRTRSRMPSSA